MLSSSDLPDGCLVFFFFFGFVKGDWLVKLCLREYIEERRSKCMSEIHKIEMILWSGTLFASNGSSLGQAVGKSSSPFHLLFGGHYILPEGVKVPPYR